VRGNIGTALSCYAPQLQNSKFHYKADDERMEGKSVIVRASSSMAGFISSLLNVWVLLSEKK
jgi:hypothetical protein